MSWHLPNGLPRDTLRRVSRGREGEWHFHPWHVRAGVNLTYILVYLALTLLLRKALAIS